MCKKKKERVWVKENTYKIFNDKKKIARIKQKNAQYIQQHTHTAKKSRGHKGVHTKTKNNYVYFFIPKNIQQIYFVLYFEEAFYIFVPFH